MRGWGARSSRGREIRTEKKEHEGGNERSAPRKKEESRLGSGKRGSGEKREIFDGKNRASSQKWAYGRILKGNSSKGVLLRGKVGTFGGVLSSCRSPHTATDTAAEEQDRVENKNSMGGGPKCQPLGDESANHQEENHDKSRGRGMPTRQRRGGHRKNTRARREYSGHYRNLRRPKGRNQTFQSRKKKQTFTDKAEKPNAEKKRKIFQGREREGKVKLTS